MARGNGLCRNCKHQKDCSLLATDQFTWECSEFSERRNYLSYEDHQQNLRPTMAMHEFEASGLCSSCDHLSSCNLRANHKVILNCEHYQ